MFRIFIFSYSHTHTHTYTHTQTYTLAHWSSHLGLQNTPTASLKTGKTPPMSVTKRCDIKQFDGETPVMLVLWGIWSTRYCHRSQVLSGPEW